MNRIVAALVLGLHLTGCALLNVRPTASMERTVDPRAAVQVERLVDRYRLVIGVRAEFFPMADRRFTGGGVVIDLFDDRCTDGPALARFPEVLRRHLRAATFTRDDVIRAGCWIELDGVIGVTLDDGTTIRLTFPSD